MISRKVEIQGTCLFITKSIINSWNFIYMINLHSLDYSRLCTFQVYLLWIKYKIHSCLIWKRQRTKLFNTCKNRHWTCFSRQNNTIFFQKKSIGHDSSTYNNWMHAKVKFTINQMNCNCCLQFFFLCVFVGWKIEFGPTQKKNGIYWNYSFFCESELTYFRRIVMSIVFISGHCVWNESTRALFAKRQKKNRLKNEHDDRIHVANLNVIIFQLFVCLNK